MNPLDGEYKFQNCIFRQQNEELVEVAGCGSCGAAAKKFDQGFRCSKRNIILNSHNRVLICGSCWVGREIVDGNEQDFRKPWEIRIDRRNNPS